jgi:hypothetical protein
MAEETNNPEEGNTFKISDLPHVRSANYASIYANFAQCSISPWDIRIVFSEVGEPEPDKPAIIELATVILPPMVAQSLIGVLQQNVRLYAQQIQEAQAEAQKRAAAKSEAAQGEAAAIDATEKPPAG